MSERKERFTPGPWFCTYIGHVKECMGDPPKTVATIPGFCSEVKMDGITEKQANADLIAAAPEMYAELEKVACLLRTAAMFIEKQYGYCPIVAWMRHEAYCIDALLAKARGGAER